MYAWRIAVGSLPAIWSAVEVFDALVAAAEVGECRLQQGLTPRRAAPIASACSDSGSDSSKRHASISPRASASSALRLGRAGGHQLHDPLELGEGEDGAAALVQVAAEPS